MKMREINYQPSGKTLSAFMKSNAPNRLLVGPLGSGKSSCAVNECLRRAKAQRPSTIDGIRKFKLLVVRSTYTEIKNGTLPTWENFLPFSFAKKANHDSPIVARYEFEDLDFQVEFIALETEQDAKKVLSSEYSMCWFEEARSISKGVYDTVFGRINRYPSMLEGGPSWSGCILTTNPFDVSHWLYKLAIQNTPPTWEVFKQPGALIPGTFQINPEAENIQNLRPNYYQDQVHGKSDDWIRVNIFGEYGTYVEGRPVYENHYSDSFHATNDLIEPNPGLGLVIGADFGVVASAAVIGQKDEDGRLTILGEVVSENQSVKMFANELSAYIARNFPDHHTVTCWCDPTGKNRSLSDGDTPLEIMKRHTRFDWRESPTDNSITQRLETVRYLLDNNPMGKPNLFISGRCPQLRRAMSNGYHFRLAKGERGERGEVSGDLPEKSHPASDLADSLGYLAIGVGGWDSLLNKRGRSFLDHDPNYYSNPRGRMEQRKPMIARGVNCDIKFDEE